MSDALEIVISRPATKNLCRGALPRLRPSSYPSHATPVVLPHPRRPVSLPNEIIALIIQSIDFDLPYQWPGEVYGTALGRTLARCCLVAKAFLVPARARLYGRCKVTVSARAGAEAPQVAVIVGRPHLASLVRKAVLESFAIQPRPHTAFLHVRSLLGSATRLTELEVTNYSPFNLGVLAHFVMAARPVLARLTLATSGADANIISELLRSQPTLKRLTLRLPHVFQPAGPPPTFALSALELATRGGHAAGPTFDFVTASSSETLQSLSLALDSHTGISLVPFAALHTLSLDHRSYYAHPLDFSSLPTLLLPLSLRNFTLHSRDSTPSSPSLFSSLPPTLISLRLPLPSPSAVIAFLNDSNQCPSLERLSLHYSMQRSWTPTEQVDVARAARRRGRVLVMPDAMTDEEMELAERLMGEYEEAAREAVRSRTLEECWGRA